MSTLDELPILISSLIILHIIAGVVALLTFLVPLVSLKGGRVHRGVGWVYAIAMLIVAVTAFFTTPWRYFADPSASESSKSFALFLFFIALFSLTALQQGVLVLRRKKQGGYSFETIGLPVVLMVFSVFVLVLGLQTQNWLHLIFTGLAFRSATVQIGHWRKAELTAKDWWTAHLDNMFTCCIATVTAFMVTAVPRIWPGLPYPLTLWIAPSVIMTPWLVSSKIKYSKKFAKASRSSAQI